MDGVLSTRPAGFWIRAVALLIDSVLTGIVLAAVFVMAGRGPLILASLIPSILVVANIFVSESAPFRVPAFATALTGVAALWPGGIRF